MAVRKTNRTSPAQVPIHNVNTYVRVPGYPPYPLGRALQEWDGITTVQYTKTDPGENNPREVREIRFDTTEGEVAVVVTEQVFEVALYTRASKRFADWMRANKEAVKAGA